MAAEDRSGLAAALGHHFVHPELLEQALTHGSLRHEQQSGGPGEQPEDNERLEFLGDAIVGLLIAELLFRRYPELHEGELTRLRAALVSRKHLGQVGLKLELGSYLLLGRAEERSGGRRKAVLLANCIEALVAALYLEGGLDAASQFVKRHIAEPYVEALRDEMRVKRAIGDYKSGLQELLQSRRAGQPEYLVKAESGPDHRKRFLVEVRIAAEGNEAPAAAQGEGTTKKKAEQEAARLLYEQLTERGAKQATVEASGPGAGAPGTDAFDKGGAAAGEHPIGEHVVGLPAGDSSAVESPVKNGRADAGLPAEAGQSAARVPRRPKRAGSPKTVGADAEFAATSGSSEGRNP